MTKITTILIFLSLFSIRGFSQSKDVLKLEKLYNEKNYEKCILKSTDYINKNKTAPYYFMAMSYFYEYHEFKDNVSIKLASKNLYKGMQLKEQPSLS